MYELRVFGRLAVSLTTVILYHFPAPGLEDRRRERQWDLVLPHHICSISKSKSIVWTMETIHMKMDIWEVGDTFK